MFGKENRPVEHALFGACVSPCGLPNRTPLPDQVPPASSDCATDALLPQLDTPETAMLYLIAAFIIALLAF